MLLRNYRKTDKDAAMTIFAKYWTDKDFLNELTKSIDGGTAYFYVAELDGEIVGIAGLRQAPAYLKSHAKTKHAAELYIVAAKDQGNGVGTMLVQRIIDEAKKLQFTEIECYSPNTHSSSWKFYEKLGFINHGLIEDPEDGYPGALLIKAL